jgi:peptidyl-prolyl cis-trans isomerase C
MHLKRILLFASLCLSLAAQTPAADPQKVVATIAGRNITAAEIQKMLSLFNAQEVQTFQQNPEFILGQYFLFLHLAEEGEKDKLLEKSPYKEQYEVLRTQLLRNAKVNEENNTYPVSAEMIEAYYKQHAAQYQQAKIKVIYIAYAGAAGPVGTDVPAMQQALKDAMAGAKAKRPEAEARTLADDIVKQLRGGANFAKLAEQYSEDKDSKATGGDFGFIKAVSEYPADFKSAVFALKPGEISDPIRQPAAFYIVRVDEMGTQPSSEVGESIIHEIRNEHFNQWMKDLSASYQAVIKDPDYFKTAGTPPVLNNK